MRLIATNPAASQAPGRASQKTSAARYYIPICLYPHTKYRTRAGVAALFDKFQLHSRDHLIVIADRLLVLDRLVTGRYWTVESATVAARREAAQIEKLIRRIARRAGAQARAFSGNVEIGSPQQMRPREDNESRSDGNGIRSHGRIVFWDDIAASDSFAEFARRLRSELRHDPALSAAIEAFARPRVARFGLGAAPDRECAHECEYLLSEICMSVYCTEVLRYSTEVWERPPTPGAPDPLKLLYSDHKDLIGRTTGGPAARVLEFLDCASH